MCLTTRVCNNFNWNCSKGIVEDNSGITENLLRCAVFPGGAGSKLQVWRLCHAKRSVAAKATTATTVPCQFFHPCYYSNLLPIRVYWSLCNGNVKGVVSKWWLHIKVNPTKLISTAVSIANCDNHKWPVSSKVRHTWTHRRTVLDYNSIGDTNLWKAWLASWSSQESVQSKNISFNLLLSTKFLLQLKAQTKISRCIGTHII